MKFEKNRKKVFFYTKYDFYFKLQHLVSWKLSIFGKTFIKIFFLIFILRISFICFLHYLCYTLYIKSLSKDNISKKIIVIVSNLFQKQLQSPSRFLLF